MSESSPPLRVCVLAATEQVEDDLGLPCRTVDILSGEALRQGLQELHREGFSHAILLDPSSVENPDILQRFQSVLEAHPTRLLIAPGHGHRGARLGVRLASGLRLRDPEAPIRCLPLSCVADRRFVMAGPEFGLELLIKSAWAGVDIEELDVPSAPPVPARPFSFWRLHMFVRLIIGRWFLPPAFLELVTRSSFHSLKKRERFRAGFNELFLREPGSSLRVGLSAGFGFFMGLAPVWGYQILIVVLITSRLGLSKTVALLCAQISLPPLIPFIMYGSLVIGRTLLGVEPGEVSTALEVSAEDFKPWLVGSFALALSAGIAGGTLVWILTSIARSLRSEEEA